MEEKENALANATTAEEEETKEQKKRKKKKPSLLLSILLGTVRSATCTLIIAIYCLLGEALAAEVVAAANREVKVKAYSDYTLATMYPACPAMFIGATRLRSANFSGNALESYSEVVLLHLRGRRAASLFEEDFRYHWQQSRCLLKRKHFAERPHAVGSH
ncbi:phospholipase D-like protein [Phytophthora cinnamomi]|uniref:phospholipase D-like protein n=1 Tax=Phytophthora cinnamomi TaxID=4785 RepID=UPI00355A3A80|nr:phospholipase D-like protein [Phytophthora cinnamomi]